MYHFSVGCGIRQNLTTIFTFETVLWETLLRRFSPKHWRTSPFTYLNFMTGIMTLWSLRAMTELYYDVLRSSCREDLGGATVIFFVSAKIFSVDSNKFYDWRVFKNKIFLQVISVFQPFVQQEMLLYFSQ
jgi:hypothetical protein